MSHSAHARQFHSALRWLAAGRTAAQMVSWVITILVIRLLSPADYGLAAMVATVTSLIALVAEFGFGVAIVQAREVSREQMASIAGAAIIFGALASLAVVALAPLAAAYYSEPNLTALLQVAGLSFLVQAIGTVPDAQLRRANRFSLIASADFGSVVVGSVMTYALALSGAGVWSLLLGQLGSAAARVMILQVMTAELIWPSLHLGRAIHLIRFGSQVAISRVAGYFVGQSDFLIAGRFLGKDLMGQYFVAIDLAMLPLGKVMNIVNQAALPTLANISRDNALGKKALLLKSLRMLSYVMIPALWGMAAVGPWLIPVVLGEKWQQAVLPLQLICYILPLRMLGNLIATALLSFGHADIELRNEFTSAVIFPLAFFIGVQFGIAGLAGAWCAALPLAVGLNFARSRHALGLTAMEVAAALAPPLGLSLIMTLTVTGTGLLLDDLLSGWMEPLLLVAAGVAVFGGCLWVFDRSSAVAMIRVVLPKRLKTPT